MHRSRLNLNQDHESYKDHELFLASCKTEISKNISKDMLLKELQSKLAPSCKVVEFKLFGMSLASINMIMSFIFTILYYKMFLWIKKTSK